MNSILIGNHSSCLGAVRSFAVLVLLMATQFGLQGQTAKDASPTLMQAGTSLPSGFPVLKDTGNPKEDNKQYDAAKKTWIEANNEEYEQIIKEMKSPVLGISEAGAVSATNIPDVHIATNSDTATPAAWPVMIPPYNPAQSNVTDVPVQFENVPVAKQQTTEKEVSGQDSELPAGFPVMKNTGNMEQDIKNYSREKDAWIENNPEQYLQLNKPDGR